MLLFTEFSEGCLSGTGRLSREGLVSYGGRKSKESLLLLLLKGREKLNAGLGSCAIEPLKEPLKEFSEVKDGERRADGINGE